MAGLVLMIIVPAILLLMCKLKMLFAIRVFLRIMFLFTFMVISGDLRIEDSIEEKIKCSKRAKCIRNAMIVVFFIFLWPYIFNFPSVEELLLGVIILIPVSIFTNNIRLFSSERPNHKTIKTYVVHVVYATVVDTLVFALGLVTYYGCSIVLVGFSYG